jgi:hypothetical protein
VSRRHPDALLKKLGKYKTNGGCFYINKLEDIDMKVLIEMISLTLKKHKLISSSKMKFPPHFIPHEQFHLGSWLQSVRGRIGIIS